MFRFLLSAIPVTVLVLGELSRTYVSAALCSVGQPQLTEIYETLPIGAAFFDATEPGYTITKRNPSNPYQDEFIIDQNKFLLAKELDAAVNGKRRNYEVSCNDTSGTTTDKTLPIIIKDFNNHAPQIENGYLNLPQVNLTEFSSDGTVLEEFKADDGDVDPDYKVSLFYIDQTIPPGSSPFGIPNPRTGQLVIIRPLDYDEPTFDRQYTLHIIARDNANANLTSSVTATVTIAISDMDDLAPAFLQSNYTASTDEEQNPGPVVTVEARDQDTGINGKVKYSIAEGNTTVFEVDETSGVISTKVAVDKETIPSPSYLLILKAEQVDNSKQSAIAVVRITIRDINDNAPVMSQAQYEAKVSETGFPDQNVISVTASDADEGENAEFKYVIDDDSTEAFQIDPTTGLITVKDSTNLNATLVPSVSFKVYAEETKTSVPQRSPSSTVLITVVSAGGGGEGSVAKTYEEIRDAEWALIGLGAALFVGVVVAIIVLIKFSRRHRKQIDTAVHNELRRTSVETQEFTVQIHDNISEIGSVDLLALTSTPDPTHVASARGGRPEDRPDIPNGHVNPAYDGSDENSTSQPNGAVLNVAKPEEGVDEPDDKRSQDSNPEQGPSDKDTSEHDKDTDKSDKESSSSAASTPPLIVRRPKMGTTGDNYVPDPEEEINNFAQFVVAEAIIGGKVAAERAERGSDDEASGGSSSDEEKEETERNRDEETSEPSTSADATSGTDGGDLGNLPPPLPFSNPPSRVMSDLMEDEEKKDGEDEEASTAM